MTSFINDDNEQLNYSGDDILITRQVASFRDFTIKGDVSISFTIPNTSENRKALGYFGLSQVDSPIFSPNQFSMVKNGNVLTRGYLVIEGDDGNELDIFFISGNANWFRTFEFTCKNISNPRLSVVWEYGFANARRGATEGIVFPHIDWMFKRQKFDQYNWVARVIDESNGARSPYPFTNLFPCLYIHTLVNEISKVSGVKIAGSLMDDKFYQSLIITPEGPELHNNAGRIVNFSAGYSVSSGIFEVTPDPAFPNGRVRVQDIAPDVPAVDIIKWLCFTFGCIPHFDEYSQTLYLNVIDKIKKEDAEDWSEYVQGYKIQYDQYQNNYLRVPEAPEQEIKDYNIQHPDALFGELNIESEKEDGSSQDLFTSPFAPVRDDVGTTPLAWATPFIEFYTLEDGDEIEFTSVENSADFPGKAQFNLVFNFDVEEITQDAVLCVRIEDEDNVYSGYHLITRAKSSYILSGCDFISDVSGFAYIQKISLNDAGPRVLVYVPDYPVSSFTSADSISLVRDGSYSRVGYAYFHKPTYSDYSNLNGYRPGLAYGAPDIEETVLDPAVDDPELYYYTITIAITSELLVYGSANYYYKVGSGAWTLLTSNNELDQLNNVYPTYTILTDYTFSVLQGQTVQLGCKDNDGNNITFGVTNAPAATYTPYCGQDPTTEFTPTADVTKYVNLKVTSGTPNVYTTC